MITHYRIQQECLLATKPCMASNNSSLVPPGYDLPGARSPVLGAAVQLACATMIMSRALMRPGQTPMHGRSRDARCVSLRPVGVGTLMPSHVSPGTPSAGGERIGMGSLRRDHVGTPGLTTCMRRSSIARRWQGAQQAYAYAYACAAYFRL